MRVAANQFRRSTICEAVQFLSTDQVQDIIDFVGLPVSVDFLAEGKVRLRVIRGALDVAVAYEGDYVVKHENGKIEAVKQAEFEELYEPVGSG